MIKDSWLGKFVLDSLEVELINVLCDGVHVTQVNGGNDVTTMSMYFGLVGRECLGVGEKKSPDFADLVIVAHSCYPLVMSMPCSL